MPHPCPHHCPPGRGSGLGLIIAIIILIGAAAAVRTAAPAIEHGLSVLLEVAVITAASLAGLAVLGVAACVAARVHRSRARTRQAITRHTPVIQARSTAVSGMRRPAIEAPRPALYVVHPESARTEEHK